jgi:hypothetical protein
MKYKVTIKFLLDVSQDEDCQQCLVIFKSKLGTHEAAEAARICRKFDRC